MNIHLYTKTSLNKRVRIPKGQSKMDNEEKLATQGTQDERNTKQKHNTIMCPIPLSAKQML